MNYVLDKSIQVRGNNLQLFSAPDVNTSVQCTYKRQYNSAGQISSGSVIEFDVPNPSADYISLRDTYLCLSLQILDANGKAITDADDVALINLCSATIFRQVDVNVQQENITRSIGANYPYKSIFDTLLLASQEDQTTWLKTAGFEKDFAKLMDSHTPSTSANGGLKERYNLTEGGKIARLTTYLFVDLFKQDRLMINNVALNFKFFPANDRFCLMYTKGTKEYKVKIVDAALYVTYVKLNDSLYKSLQDNLEEEAALYPYVRSDLKNFTIAQGAGDWSMDNIFHDNIPDELYIAMVDSDAYNGNPEKNPLNFKNMRVCDLTFEISGVCQESHKFNPSFEYETEDKTTHAKTSHGHDDYFNSYISLFESLIPNQKSKPNITNLDFKYGYCIHKFTITKNLLLENSNSPMRKGQTRLSLKFKTTLENPITVLVYGRFNSILRVNENKTINLEI